MGHHSNLTDVSELDLPPDRLRALLAANLRIAGAVELDDVLRHIVLAAKELVGARRAALAMLHDGRVVRFVHTGLDESADTTDATHSPIRKERLGKLIDYPEPVRLTDLSNHRTPPTNGRPSAPPYSFLGAPITIGDQVYATLYLTEKSGADGFSDDDQRVIQLFATAAAVAIDNAALLAQARRRHAWQSAMVEVTTSLLTGSDPDEALRQLVHQATIAASATGAGVAVLTDDPDQVRVSHAEGSYARWQGRTFARQGTLADAALTAGQAVLIEDPMTDARTAALTRHIPHPLGETVAVPIFVDGSASGVLVVSREPQQESFDQSDLELISTYAAQVGLALRLADVRRDTETLHLAQDRHHIAEDLRQHVIRRLFAVGLSLQGAAGRTTSEVVATTLTAAIAELDAIIHDIRAKVFAIDRPDREPAPTLDSRVSARPEPRDVVDARR